VSPGRRIERATTVHRHLDLVLDHGCGVRKSFSVRTQSRAMQIVGITGVDG
jgi:hypothetical protein